MINIDRYRQGLKRRFQRWQCYCAFRQSPKPLEYGDKTYVTLFFDYEGKSSHVYCDLEQDGYSRKGMVHILNRLDQAGFQATFNCVGKLIEEHRDLFIRIAQSGHEIASHTIGHTLVDRWSVAQVVEDMEQFRNLLAPIATMVLGFRAPQSRWSSSTIQGLLKSNVLWNAEDDLSPFPYIIAQVADKSLWRMPVTIDDWAMEGRCLNPAAMLEAWSNAVKIAIHQKRYVSIGFHPWVLGRTDLRLDAFSQFIDFLCNYENIRVDNFGNITRFCQSQTKNKQ